MYKFLDFFPFTGKIKGMSTWYQAVLCSHTWIFVNELSWNLVLVPETVEHFPAYPHQSRLARLVVNTLNYVHVLYKDIKFSFREIVSKFYLQAFSVAQVASYAA